MRSQVEEFFAVKGVSGDCDTLTFKSMIPFRLPIFRCKGNLCSQTNRLLLIGELLVQHNARVSICFLLALFCCF